MSIPLPPWPGPAQTSSYPHAADASSGPYQFNHSSGNSQAPPNRQNLSPWAIALPDTIARTHGAWRSFNMSRVASGRTQLFWTDKDAAVAIYRTCKAYRDWEPPVPAFGDVPVWPPELTHKLDTFSGRKPHGHYLVPPAHWLFGREQRHGPGQPKSLVDGAQKNRFRRALRRAHLVKMKFRRIVGHGGMGLAALFDVDKATSQFAKLDCPDEVVVKISLTQSLNESIEEEHRFHGFLRRAQHHVKRILPRDMFADAAIRHIIHGQNIFTEDARTPDGNPTLGTATVLENMKLGTLDLALRRLSTLNAHADGTRRYIDEETLWRMLQCLVKAAVAMKYPPNRQWANAVDVDGYVPQDGPNLPEIVPPRGMEDDLNIVHFDIDPRNIFVGDYSAPSDPVPGPSPPRPEWPGRGTSAEVSVAGRSVLASPKGKGVGAATAATVGLRAMNAAAPAFVPGQGLNAGAAAFVPGQAFVVPPPPKTPPPPPAPKDPNHRRAPLFKLGDYGLAKEFPKIDPQGPDGNTQRMLDLWGQRTAGKSGYKLPEQWTVEWDCYSGDPTRGEPAYKYHSEKPPSEIAGRYNEKSNIWHIGLSMMQAITHTQLSSSYWAENVTIVNPLATIPTDLNDPELAEMTGLSHGWRLDHRYEGGTPKPTPWRDITRTLRKTIMQMLMHNPKDRPCLEALLEECRQRIEAYDNRDDAPAPSAWKEFNEPLAPPGHSTWTSHLTDGHVPGGQSDHLWAAHPNTDIENIVEHYRDWAEAVGIMGPYIAPNVAGFSGISSVYSQS